MYRIVVEKHLITNRKFYFIEKEKKFLGFKWWSSTIGVPEIDDSPYGFFSTEAQAKRALSIIKTGETIRIRIL